jgi:hypothetical protein
MERPRRRPFGVTAIVVLLILSALVLFGEGVWEIQTTIHDRGATLEPLSATGTLALLGRFLVLVISGAANLVAAIGLWQLRRWAWVLVMLLVGSRLAANLWLYFTGGGALYVEMLLDVIMVFYLNQRELQQAFGHRDERNRLLDVPVQQAP